MAKIIRPNISREYKSRTVTVQQEQFNRRPPNFQPSVTQKGPPQHPIPTSPPHHSPQPRNAQPMIGRNTPPPPQSPQDTSYVKLYEESKINYSAIRDTCHFNMAITDEVDVSIIVPVRSRVYFNRHLVRHLRLAMENFPEKTYSITFVEFNSIREHEDVCVEQKVNYIHVPQGQTFNKCLSFNVGVLFGNKANYYVFHDLDIMVKKDFFSGIFANLDLHKTALQTFTQRRVLYCSNPLSQSIMNGQTSVEELSNKSQGITEPDRDQRKAPGGSIFCSRDQFFDIGGFDAELFQGYSVEDQFFFDKLQITCGIHSCNTPQVEVFHLWHDPLWNSNPKATLHHSIYDEFKRQSREGKYEFFKMEMENINEFR